MEEQRKIKIQVVSNNGHDEFALVPKEALDFIRNKCGNEGKWAYADGDYINVDTLTEEDLADINEIMLANMLRGGNAESYKTTISFTDQDCDFKIAIQPNEISIFCNNNRMGILMKNIKTISKLLLNWLTTQARKEVVNIAHQVGAPLPSPSVYEDPDIDTKVLATETATPNDNLALIANYDIENSILNITYNKELWYPTLYARKYISHIMVNKLNDFAKNNIDKIREAVKY